jgi:hypothetical protein
MDLFAPLCLATNAGLLILLAALAAGSAICCQLPFACCFASWAPSSVSNPAIREASPRPRFFLQPPGSKAARSEIALRVPTSASDWTNACVRPWLSPPHDASVAHLRKGPRLRAQQDIWALQAAPTPCAVGAALADRSLVGGVRQERTPLGLIPRDQKEDNHGSRIVRTHRQCRQA